MISHDIATWRSDLLDIGGARAASLGKWDKFEKRGKSLRKFHVVSAVEDFDTIGLSVREGLAVFGEVRFSCLWPQYEILAQEPLIETSPIFRSFHEREFDEPYYLVFAVSNIGSAVPVRAMIINTVEERGLQSFETIEILCSVSHPRALTDLRDSLPHDIAGLVRWWPYRRDRFIRNKGYTASLGSISPSEMMGMGSLLERENFTPPTVAERIENLPRRPRRPDPNGGTRVRVL